MMSVIYIGFMSFLVDSMDLAGCRSIFFEEILNINRNRRENLLKKKISPMIIFLKQNVIPVFALFFGIFGGIFVFF